MDSVSATEMLIKKPNAMSTAYRIWMLVIGVILLVASTLAAPGITMTANIKRVKPEPRMSGATPSRRPDANDYPGNTPALRQAFKTVPHLASGRAMYASRRRLSLGWLRVN
jgi:hypothetical protein